jgi:hypothetical protein
LNVFLICGAFYVFSTIVYAVLADGKEQKWAHAKGTESEKKTTKV